MWKRHADQTIKVVYPIEEIVWSPLEDTISKSSRARQLRTPNKGKETTLWVLIHRFLEIHYYYCIFHLYYLYYYYYNQLLRLLHFMSFVLLIMHRLVTYIYTVNTHRKIYKMIVIKITF